jgi:CheY-like chemotaxis protein
MVVLVDNDRDDMDLLKEALYRNNFIGEVAFVSSGQILIDLLHKMINQFSVVIEPELILLDLSIPFKNGFDALRNIKNNPLLKSIPVIVYSSSTNKYDEHKCFELGCNLFFRKPTSMDDYDELVSVIINYLKTCDMVKKNLIY